MGIKHGLLRPQNRRGPKVFVHRGHKGDVVILGHIPCAPQLKIDRAQGRPAIPRDKPSGVQPLLLIAPRLIQHDPHQRLGAGQKHRSFCARVAVG